MRRARRGKGSPSAQCRPTPRRATPTGPPPFDGGTPGTPAAVLLRIVSAEPDLSAVPPVLRQVIEACLMKDPGRRPSPAQLTALISSRGPAVVASLGSFWPEDVA